MVYCKQKLNLPKQHEGHKDLATLKSRSQDLSTLDRTVGEG